MDASWIATNVGHVFLAMSRGAKFSDAMRRSYYFNPEEREPLLDELREKQAVFSRELQLKRKDGSPVWVLFRAAALNAEHGAPMLQATMIDISEWKRSDEALSGMTRKLIRILGSQVNALALEESFMTTSTRGSTMLSLDLEQLQENPSEVQSRVQELRNQTTELSNDVQKEAMSHDLHSSKLEYLGVIAEIKKLVQGIRRAAESGDRLQQ